MIFRRGIAWDSGPIGYRTAVFMKAVDGKAGFCRVRTEPEFGHLVMYG